VDDTTINKWKYNLKKYNLENAELAIRQNSMNTSAISDKIKALEQSLSQNNKFLLTKEETIKEKEAKIMALKQELLRINSNKIPFLEITQDLKNLFPKLQGVEFANEIHTNFDALDTVPKIKLIWQDSLAAEIKTDNELRIKNWLKDKVANPKLEVISE
jgi:hypothetical protein